MKTKLIVTLDDCGMILTKDGVSSCTALPMGCGEPVTGYAERTMQLVKLGVTVEDILKLKNADLLQE